MPQPRFDELRERLLHAGIAPRHVRRTIGELRDHFDDLVREEIANGAARNDAEIKALARLGHEDDLVEAVLARPGLRSFAARYPWAVFNLAPLALLAAVLVGAILVEIQALHAIGLVYPNTAHRPPPAWFMDAVAAWNALPTIVAPLVIAGILCFVGARQRISPAWIFSGVVIVCVLGAFQKVTFAENGYHGELMLTSALGPPFPRDMIVAGIWRAIADLALVGGAWWLVTRRSSSSPSEAAATVS